MIPTFGRKVAGVEKRTSLFQSAMEVAKDIVQENWSRIVRLTIGASYYGPVLDGARIMDLIVGAIEMEEDASISSSLHC